jgi:hypothetical protein
VTLLDRKLGTGSLLVKVNGTPLQLSETGTVTIRHGRSKPDGQPDASSCSLVSKAAILPEVGQTLTVELGPSAIASFGTVAAATPRFVGRITTAQLVPEPGDQSRRRRVNITATGQLASLGRQLVGDAPWPQETDGARVARLLALATGVTVGVVDSGTVQVLPRDVDRQPILKLAQEIATDADGVLHQLRNGNITYHDADHRQVVPLSVELLPSEVLWPVVWQQDLDGMVNDLTVGYGAAEPQAEVRETDAAAIASHGLYAARVATQLADLAAADAYALLTIARRGRPWWDLSTVSTDLVRGLGTASELHPHAAKLLALELGDLCQITSWPSSGPQQLGRLWVEGWTETITPTSWRMVLSVTPYGRTGPPARWLDVNATTTWATFGPLTWAQLASWDAGLTVTGLWRGAPSATSWATAPAATWATWPY